MLEQDVQNVTIVIDVFRAFTTACYILQQKPARYLMTNECATIELLSKQYSEATLVGKPQVNSTVQYHIPNSPTRAGEMQFYNKTVLHRTQAGATGLLRALGAAKADNGRVFASSFVNADATLRVLSSMVKPQWSVMPMGHEANEPSLEDDLCAQYLMAKEAQKSFLLESYYPVLRQQAGQYFFGDDQQQYPKGDFNCCLELNHFDFAIEAFAVEGYAELVPVYTTDPNRSPVDCDQAELE